VSSEQSISVVVPLHRCEACIVELYNRLVATLTPLVSDFEIILVNDGSPQDDWKVARQLAEKDRRVKAINLSRNFGQHYAISAGVDYADGDWVVVMDGDLQDPPEEIPRLYQKAREGNHDVVFGIKPKRSHGFFKRLTSKMFTRVLGYLMDTKLDNAVTHFSIVSRKVAKNVRRFRERNRSYAFLVRWLGFDVAYVEVQHHARFAGDSSYTFRKLVGLALELMVSQSDKPLRVTITFGFAVALAAFVYGFYRIIWYAIWNVSVSGWTSVIVSIYFLGGLTFVALGVVGLYVGCIFDEIKRRPLYVVKEALNVAPAQAAAYDDLRSSSETVPSPKTMSRLI
jgi:dolichol-phosphate mannosyltransferase